ncbi:MAG: hypothetical protein HFE59_10940 [Clostridiales bacterium]|nr:hypothetical protein [Clostridiales bacterium]
MINNIVSRNYVITEIQAPDNYALNNTPKII